MCAYNDLATEQGGGDVTGIIDRQEPTGDCWWSASRIGRGIKDDRPRVEVIKKSDPHRVKIVTSEQGTAGHEACRELKKLVRRQEDEDGEEVVRGKRP